MYAHMCLCTTVYGEGLWTKYMAEITFDSKVKAAVIFGTTSEHKSFSSTLPILCHLSGSATPPPKSSPGFKIYTYPTSRASNFALPSQADFNGADESVAHTRNLTHLKKFIQGAEFDLEAIWDEHTYYEFADRSAAKTMGTMVQEPYVNHIPTVRLAVLCYPGFVLLTNKYLLIILLCFF